MRGCIAEFQRDCKLWDALNAIDETWNDLRRKRSVFNKRSVEHTRLCLDAEGWAGTRKIVTTFGLLSTRFISQLCCEEMFNKIKHDVSSSSSSSSSSNSSSNTCCTPQRAMANCIDTGVLSTTNSYAEVKRENETVERSFSFDKDTFKNPEESEEAGLRGDTYGELQTNRRRR